MLNRETSEKIILSALPEIMAEDLEFIRLGENAVFKDINKGLVIRVYRNHRTIEYVSREIEILTKLNQRGLNVPEVSSRYETPIMHMGHAISVWKEIKSNPNSKIPFEKFGQLLLQIHDEMKKVELEAKLPIWNPLKATQNRFNRVLMHGLISKVEEQQLSKLISKVEQEYKKIIHSQNKLQLIHGDSHIGNLLIQETSNKLFMLDFENNSKGIIEWDLIPTLIAHERFGLDVKEYDAFVAGYGRDLRESSLYKPLKLIREASMTMWLLQKRGENETVDNEIDVRLDSLFQDTQGVNWGAF